MKTNLKRFSAFVTMLVIMLLAVLPVSAAGISGNDFVLVGKGADYQSIVMDLDGKSEVSAVYYPVTKVKMSQPEYLIEVDDVSEEKGLKVNVFYNDDLEMYGIKVTAKEMMDESFVIKFFKLNRSNYERFSYASIHLTVIDGDERLYDPDEYYYDEDEDDEYIDEILRTYQSQSKKVNVVEGLEACAKDQFLTVDISDSGLIPASWMSTLKKYPEKALTLAGNRYSWTVKGADVKASSSRLSYHADISRSSVYQADIERLSGINNVPVVVIADMKNFPVSKAILRVQILGNVYKNTDVNIYLYENGKVFSVAEDVRTDKNGYVSFPVSKGGVYFVSRFKSANVSKNV